MAIKLLDVVFALSIERLAMGIFILLVNGSASRCDFCTIIKKNHIQVPKLAGVILALSIKIRIDVILAQQLKTTYREMMTWQGFHRFVAARKLYCFIEFLYLGVLALTS